MNDKVSSINCELDFCCVLVYKAEVGAWDDLREEGEMEHAVVSWSC